MGKMFLTEKQRVLNYVYLHGEKNVPMDKELKEPEKLSSLDRRLIID